MRLALALFTAILCGCSSTSKQGLRLETLSPRLGPAVFPYGKYRHSARVKTVEPAREIPLMSVVEISEEALRVVGLSPMGTTLFKLYEDRHAGKMRAEFFDPSLERARSYVDLFYPLLREILLLTRDRADAGALRILQRSSEGWPIQLKYRGRVDVELNSYGLSGPRQIELHTPEFRAQVEVERL